MDKNANDADHKQSSSSSQTTNPTLATRYNDDDSLPPMYYDSEPSSQPPKYLNPSTTNPSLTPPPSWRGQRHLHLCNLLALHPRPLPPYQPWLASCSRMARRLLRHLYPLPRPCRLGRNTADSCKAG